MARFKASLRTIDIDVAGYERALTESLEEQLKEALRLWLAEVTGRIPLFSGMARASLLEVARLANGQVALVPRKGRSRVLQGEALGDASLNTTPAKVDFTFNSSVPQWEIQESNTGKSPAAPWRALEAGQRFLESVKVNLPPLDPFVKVKTVS